MLRVAVVGATGYTGAELVRILDGHPEVRVVARVGHSKAGVPWSRALPSRVDDTELVAPLDLDRLSGESDVVFTALPHGASAATVGALRARGLPVFDLSADFRLRDRAVYERWYGVHGAPECLSEAVYGLPELHRAAITRAQLVAVPGCYPTATLLALAPLVADRLIDASRVVVDAKSGVSGAGRASSERTHFSETAEGVRAYKSAGTHRHVPEIEQELSVLAGADARVAFTPHLLPMIRGMLATAYALPRTSADGAVTAAVCVESARAFFAGSPSVVVLDGGDPDTLWIRGSNRAIVSYAVEARTGMILAQCAIDNLVKGASGQAVQCMNLRFGFAEGTGLEGYATWP